MSVLNDPFKPDLRQLPDDLRQLAEQELAPGERLQWIGQPRARRQILQWLLMPLVGLPLTVMTAWVVVALDEISDRLLALAFLFAGLWLLCAPWWAVLRSRRTFYLLTDQRALILRVGEEQPVQSFTPVSLQQVKCRQFRGGYGDLVFRRGQVMSQYREGPSLQIQGFLSIPDVRRVEFLVRRLAKTWRGHLPVGG